MKFKIDKQAVIEAGQEVARVAFFAGVSAAISFGLNRLGMENQSEVTVMVGTLILKGLDKWVHENKSIKLNGLTDTKIFK